MKVIYVMDPLCGWCYGSAANITKLYDQFKDEITFDVLPAGMWSNANVRKQTPQMAAFFIKHDKAVTERTGAVFGTPYLQFLENADVVLDSEIPSRAIVTIKEIAPEYTVPFMVAVQEARYLEGKDLNRTATYLDICEKSGIDKQRFLDVFNSDSIKVVTRQTFDQANRYAHSYPTLLFENEGKITVLEQGYAPLTLIESSIKKLK